MIKFVIISLVLVSLIVPSLAGNETDQKGSYPVQHRTGDLRDLDMGM